MNRWPEGTPRLWIIRRERIACHLSLAALRRVRLEVLFASVRTFAKLAAVDPLAIIAEPEDMLRPVRSEVVTVFYAWEGTTHRFTSHLSPYAGQWRLSLPRQIEVQRSVCAHPRCTPGCTSPRGQCALPSR